MRVIVDQVSGARGGTDLFSNVSFNLQHGEGLIITGPNGAGKSTLLRILAGLLHPSLGTIEMLDDNGAPANDCFHFLGSLNGMKDQLTSLENLDFWQSFLQSSALELTTHQDLTPHQALDAVKLSHIGDLPYGYLSTGQKRRVAIARLLCVHRPIWLVDEPTSGLDKASERLFADLASAHLKQGGILVAATHLPLVIKGMQTLAIGEALV